MDPTVAPSRYFQQAWTIKKHLIKVVKHATETNHVTLFND